MLLSKSLSINIGNSSWIRKMFEEGHRLKKIHGAENVYDYSLGNPDYEPPVQITHSLRELINGETSGLHSYMSNAGYPEVRAKIAALIEKDTLVPVTKDHIIMTSGAAGGLNVVLKSILDPGDEVIIFAPYFPDYIYYIQNCGGKVIVVPTLPDTFLPDLEQLEKSFTKQTKAIIINSPNNPTGVIYPEVLLQQINEMIIRKTSIMNSQCLLISDEPYTKIVYDEQSIPNVLTIFHNCVIVNSYSKSLALPGERIGYIVIHPSIENANEFVNGLIFMNRTLGFVNAPSLFQRAIEDNLDISVNMDNYLQRRDYLFEQLSQLGFSCFKPQGAFYMFPKALLDDDIEFVKKAARHHLLLVPGTGFGYPGYFRMAFCLDLGLIKKSISAFKALAEECNSY